MASEVLNKKPFNLEEIENKKEDDLFYFVDVNTFESERITAPKYSYWKSVFRVFFKKKTNWIILGIFIFLLFMIFLFPLIVPYDKFGNIMDVNGQRLSPSAALDYYKGDFRYILGTGRSSEPIFLAIWASAQTSFLLAICCAAINMVLGIVIGALWGYSKQLDMILNVVYNIVANVPYILVISVLVYVIGRGFGPFVFALTITGWIGIAYFFRTQVLIIRDREYNLASRCLGTKTIKVVSRNVLPFLISVIVTILATELPSYISMEVFLTYIGIGMSAETPSLGNMIGMYQDGFEMLPWAFWSPVAVAAAITIILYVLGQNLADASDPRTHMQ